MTKRQQVVLRKVFNATHDGGWYRADGNGERVTLASLWRVGTLDRRAWRGNEGEPDAAHEYRPSDDAMHAFWMLIPDKQAERCSGCGHVRAAHETGKLCSEAQP